MTVCRVKIPPLSPQERVTSDVVVIAALAERERDARREPHGRVGRHAEWAERDLVDPLEAVPGGERDGRYGTVPWMTPRGKPHLG